MKAKMNDTLEIFATLTGIIAVFLQAREKITAWPFAIISVIVLAYIFYSSRLYSDFGLHLIYILLNIYGWILWRGKGNNNKVVPTQIMGVKSMAIAVVTITISTITIGFLMHKYTDAELFYFDAFTTSGSLVAQYLLAKKYLQNWLLWIIVDLVAIPMYLYKGLYYVSFLFVTYLIICSYGYLSWKKGMDTLVVDK